MYAVVKTGGKQHKVVVGETVSVELLDADAGSVVTLPVLLVNDGEKLFTGKEAAAATVTAEVLGHGKADKIVVFKLKKRKGYKRTRGHRQGLTLIKVTDIVLEGAKKPAKAKASEAAVEKKPVAKKPVAKKAETAPAKVAATKPAAKKAAAPKAAAKPVEQKPAAKKPAVKKADAGVPAAKAAPKKAAPKPTVKKPAAKKTTKPAESAE